MKFNNKRISIMLCIAAIILLLAAIAVLLTIYFTPSNDVNSVEADIVASLEEAEEPTANAETEAEEPYVSPIDFTALQSMNPDIYAWLDIPGTEISYPILQSSTDDTYYLNRGSDGEKSSAGCLFTEHTYNNASFTDPVTVVYGHNMRNGSMFGNLQETYSDAETFAEYSEIVIYLPERELHFQVFAAVPFDNWHILYNCDFTNSKIYDIFFKKILSVRAVSANISLKTSLDPEDQVLILSTCLGGNRTRRYLVCAKLMEIS